MAVMTAQTCACCDGGGSGMTVRHDRQRGEAGCGHLADNNPVLGGELMDAHQSQKQDAAERERSKGGMETTVCSLRR